MTRKKITENEVNDSLLQKIDKIATTTETGKVKPDGVTITVSEDGTISGSNNYELPIATTNVLGGIKPDGVTILVDSISGIASSASKGEIYQDTVTRLPESNATGYFTYAKQVKYGEPVFSVDNIAGTLTVGSTTGLTVGDTVVLRNVITKAETQTTVASKTGTVITLTDKSLAVGGTTAVYTPIQTATKYQYAEGYATLASGNNSHAEGNQSLAIGSTSHAEGQRTVALGAYSHSEGLHTRAEGYQSHAEGRETKSIGTNSHSEGLSTNAIGEASHSQGYGTSAEGHYSHAEGYYSITKGNSAHAQGYYSQATGNYSHAGGNRCVSTGEYALSNGDNTTASVHSSTAIGRYNKVMTGSSGLVNNADDAFVIGNGTTSSALSNAFRVKYNGAVYGLSAFNSTGADYAEYFEWIEGNLDNEDRVGFVVTLDGDKIRKANSTDSYILGIISANPSVIGDSHQDDWNNKYVTDDFGRIQYHYVDVDYQQLVEVTEDGKEVYETVTKSEYVPILNPEWNSESEYIPREERKEWDAVGLVGKLIAYDNGTSKVNGFVKVSEVDGVFCHSDEPTQFRVMERINEKLIRVFVKWFNN